jgi:hypothetical protein
MDIRNPEFADYQIVRSCIRTVAASFCPLYVNVRAAVFPSVSKASFAFGARSVLAICLQKIECPDSGDAVRTPNNCNTVAVTS